MKKLTCLVWCCFCLTAATAQQADTLRLRIVCAVTEEPVAGATLHFDDSCAQVMDEKGEGYVIVTLPRMKAAISAAGFQTENVMLTASKQWQIVKLTPLDISLQEVVVSATLRQINRMQSPIPVESYSAHYFKRNRTSNLFEALSLVNGVQPQITCNVCNTGGLQMNGLEGPYTMVLIDGMPLVSSLATVYGLFGIPTGMIKRVEVIKGPASTLYGSEALAGIINIITQTPSEKNTWNFSQSVTGYREYNTDVGYSFKGKKTGGLLSMNNFYYQNPVDRNWDGFMDIALQQRTSFFSRFLWERNSRLPFSLAIRYLSEDRSGGEMRWSKRWRGSDSIYGESIITRRFEFLGNYGMRIGKEPLLWEFAYNAHMQDAWYGKTFLQAQQHTGFLQLRWNKKIGAHDIIAGIPFRYQWYDDNTGATVHPQTGRNLPSRNTLTGLFVQNTWQVNEAFTILGGMRWEYHNLQGLVIAPRMSVKWKATENHTIRLTGGNGFRVVNIFTEEHAALTGARKVEIDAQLKPERTWNINLHHMAHFHVGDAGLLSTDGSLFYTYFTNRILPDYDSDPEKIIYTNLKGFAISRGGSVSLALTLRNGFSANTGITVLDAFAKKETEPSRRLLYVPVFTANYGISYHWQKPGITVDFTGRTLSPMRMPIFPNDYRPEMSPWYSILNVQCTKKVAGWLEIVAGVQNILNFLPRDPIMRPFDPFDKNIDDPVNNPNGYTFDPSYNYAPMMGRRFQLAINVKIH